VNTIIGGLTKPVHGLMTDELARNSRKHLSGQDWAEITASAMRAAQDKIAELRLPADVIDTWMHDFCSMLDQD
jgi:hypothetical protein